MAWKQILNTEHLEQPSRKFGYSRIARAGEVWVIRDAYNIYAYHPMENRVLWQIADDCA